VIAESRNCSTKRRSKSSFSVPPLASPVGSAITAHWSSSSYCISVNNRRERAQNACPIGECGLRYCDGRRLPGTSTYVTRACLKRTGIGSARSRRAASQLSDPTEVLRSISPVQVFKITKPEDQIGFLDSMDVPPRWRDKPAGSLFYFDGPIFIVSHCRL
jgi:hypothetical protein